MSQSEKITPLRPQTPAPDAAVVGEELASPCFKLEIKDRIAHLILNRPGKLNTMTPAFWQDLPRIVRKIDADALARVLVISSTGKHFTAGMDLSVFARPPQNLPKEEGRRRARLMQAVSETQQTFSCLDEARIPVLMAVQGGCIGGGVDFASACDIRYATRSAFFCIQEINIGMTADVGTFPRLPYLMPQGLVRELAYTGRRLPAEEAFAAGFVTRLFDTQEEMIAEAMKTARQIAEKSPLAVWGSKEMLNYGRDHSVADSLKHIAVWQSGMFQPADMAEAFKAGQEKRAPDFEDLPPIKKGFQI